MGIHVSIYPTRSETLSEAELPLLSVLQTRNSSYFAQFLERFDWLRKEEWAYKPPLVFKTFSKPELMLHLPGGERTSADAEDYFFLRAKEFRKITPTDEETHKGLDWDRAIIAYLASLPENSVVVMRVT